MARRNISVLLDGAGTQLAVCTEDAKEVRKRLEHLRNDEWLELTNLNGGRTIHMAPLRAMTISQIVEATADIPSDVDILRPQVVTMPGAAPQ